MLRCRSEFQILTDSERHLLWLTREWYDLCCHATPAVLSVIESAFANHITVALTSFCFFSQCIPGCGSSQENTKRRLKEAHAAVTLCSKYPFSTFYKCEVFIIWNPTEQKTKKKPLITGGKGMGNGKGGWCRGWGGCKNKLFADKSFIPTQSAGKQVCQLPQ